VISAFFPKIETVSFGSLHSALAVLTSLYVGQISAPHDFVSKFDTLSSKTNQVRMLKLLVQFFVIETIHLIIS